MTGLHEVTDFVPSPLLCLLWPFPPLVFISRNSARNMPAYIVDFIPTVKPTFAVLRKDFAAACRIGRGASIVQENSAKKPFIAFTSSEWGGGTILALKIANSSIQKAKFDGLSDARQRNLLLSTPPLERGPAVIR